MTRDTKKGAPDPLKSETVIFVMTGMGQEMGCFVWPTSMLPVLKMINCTPWGYSFCWNKENDLNAGMAPMRLEYPIDFKSVYPTLREMLFPNQELRRLENKEGDG